ncbi:MAG: methyltransferase domain-containing protein [Acidobacteriia bacterium]|nr:methyltransferase domain-containing protein [Terriglobia bacterium]
MPESVAQQMREDWNRRAVEDANYYVAFGRRQQDDEEFFATASEQVYGLLLEIKRLPPSPARARRALEIGCGPGRLMRPMSRHFGEIHGVDISEEMVRLAREKLAGVAHAHPHHAPDSDLSAFADSSFDFIYSYAVFQHIPSREVVFHYLEEACRVLKPGGILRCQINGLPQEAPRYDTWSGVRISADEVKQFATAYGLHLLALEGIATQYMWTTLRKPGIHVSTSASMSAPVESAKLAIRRITNAHSSEPVAPIRGRFSSLSLWIEGLFPMHDLNHLHIQVAGLPAFVSFIGHPEHDGLQQVNLYLPEGLSSGLQPIELLVDGALAARATVRLIPPGPPVPRVLSISDGIDLLAGSRLVTGSIKATLEEVLNPEDLRAWVGETSIEHMEYFCTDPRLPRWEVNFSVPKGLSLGASTVRMALGSRELGSFPVELACQPVTKV